MQDPQSLHKYLYVHGDPIGMTDPTGMFGLGGALAGSMIGSTLNQMTGFAGEIILESLHAKRFAWEVAALGSVLMLGVPILGMAVGKVFGSAFFQTQAGKLLALADEYLTAVTGVVRESVEVLGRRVAGVPAVDAALSNVRGVLTGMRARFGPDVKVVAQLYVDGNMWTGINSWAKGGARTGSRKPDHAARVIANELGVKSPTTGLVPYGQFLNHAEGHTLIQAVADGVSATDGGVGKLFVSEIPCGACGNNMANMKRILKLDELQVWYLDDAGVAQFFGTF